MKIGDKVMYKGKVVDVIETPKKDATFVRIKNGNKELSAPVATLTPMPELAKDEKVTSQGKIGKGTVIPKEIRSQYMQHKTKTGSGKSYAIDNNDDTASALRGKDLDTVYTEAAAALKANGEDVTVASLKAKYANLNPGMQRMNLGNRIRGSAHKMETQMKRDAAKAAKVAAKAAADADKAAKAAEDAAKAAAAKAAEPKPQPPKTAPKAVKNGKAAAAPAA